MKLKIAYCGPISLRLLEDLVDDGVSLPEGYTYPLGGYLVRQYLERGHEVAVITSANGVSSHKSWYGENISIHLSPRRRARWFLMDFYKKERAYMVKDIQQANPDIVHAQWTYEFAHAAVSSGHPYLVTARDSPWAIFRHTCSWYRFYRAVYAHFVVPKIRNLSAISDYVAGPFTKTFRYNKTINIIPNGLPRKLFRSQPKVLESSKPIQFITISAWDRGKNIKDLIRAFNFVRSRLREADLILIGGGLGEGEAAQIWAARHGIDEGIQFIGLMDHSSAIKKVCREGTLFVTTTLEESFCMTVLEAMAQGLPVIAYPESGAVPWLLDYGKAGILGEKQNWHSFSEAMLYATRNLDYLNSIAKCGYERAQQHFTLERVADLYLRLFSMILCREIQAG